MSSRPDMCKVYERICALFTRSAKKVQSFIADGLTRDVSECKMNLNPRHSAKKILIAVSC